MFVLLVKFFEVITTVPTSIDLKKGWELSEAQLFNRLATTSAAKIDEVVFREFDIQLGLDGDKITVTYEGNDLIVEPDGSINVNCNVDAKDGDNIAISRHANPFTYTSNSNKTKAQLDVANYTEVFSYTSTDDLTRIGKIKVKADTLGIFRVKVNGTIIDYFTTSNMERNCIFEFSEHIDLLNSHVLTIEFIPNRLRLNNYHFFLRMEGYLED